MTSRLGQVKEVGAGVRERVGGVYGDMERWREAKRLGKMEKAQEMGVGDKEGGGMRGGTGKSEISDGLDDGDREDVEDGVVVISDLGDDEEEEEVAEWPTQLPREGAADAVWDEEKW